MLKGIPSGTFAFGVRNVCHIITKCVVRWQFKSTSYNKLLVMNTCVHILGSHCLGSQLDKPADQRHYQK